MQVFVLHTSNHILGINEHAAEIAETIAERGARVQSKDVGHDFGVVSVIIISLDGVDNVGAEENLLRQLNKTECQTGQSETSGGSGAGVGNAHASNGGVVTHQNHSVRSSESGSLHNGQCVDTTGPVKSKCVTGDDVTKRSIGGLTSDDVGDQVTGTNDLQVAGTTVRAW